MISSDQDTHADTARALKVLETRSRAGSIGWHCGYQECGELSISGMHPGNERSIGGLDGHYRRAVG